MRQPDRAVRTCITRFNASLVGGVVPETATFLRSFRNFAVIFPNSNVVTFLPLCPPDYLQSAGVPFVIQNMADTKSYGAREARKIATGTTRVVGRDDRDLAHVRPMLTMTGIGSLPEENEAK